MTARQLAIDIECVNKTDPPAFDSPSEWRVFAVALSFRPNATNDPETTVLVRRDGTERALRQLLCAMGNWIIEHRPTDTLLTFNGTSFDMPIINHHIEAIEASDPRLAAHIRDTLVISHRDLFAEICESQPEDEKWPSLDQALRDRNIESVTTKFDGDVVTGALMPAIGRRVLDSEKTLGEHERAALVKYAASDVAPLFELATALDREREARIEAEAAAICETGQSATDTGGTEQ